MTPNNTLTARYQYFRDSETNDGVGQFNEAAVGTDYLSTEHTLQLTDTQTINASTINEIRFQYVHDTIVTTPVSSAINVNVGGAFSNNGSGGGNISDTQNRFEVQDIIYKNFRKHSWKFGGRLRSTHDHECHRGQFRRTFTFGAQSLIRMHFVPPRRRPAQLHHHATRGLSNHGCSGLAAGPDDSRDSAKVRLWRRQLLFADVWRTGASVTLVDAGLFVQDDWKVRQNVTVSYGLRFETQNNFSDKSDFAPRLGVAWAIGGNAKNPPKTVLRAGFGMFYDRFTYNLVLIQERFNESGAAQQQYLIQNPTFFLTSAANPSCVPPFTLPLPAACTISSASSGTVDYQSNPNLHAPYTIQTGVTLERQLNKVSNLAVTYLNSRGVHQFYTDNINPIDPQNPTGARPIPADGDNNVYQYQSEGIFKQNQLIVNGSIRMGAKLSLFGYYTLGYADSDTSGAGSFPSLPGHLQEDYGRASYDVRHRLFFGGTVGLPRGFRLSPFLIASSGAPFNITTGSDPYQDSNFNVRPAIASCTSGGAVQTKFGCFLIPSAADLGNPATYTPIPVNYGDGPGRFSLNLRLAKTFGFGPVLESASGSGGGPMGGGTFGRPGGGGPRGGPGGGRGGPDAGATNRRYALTFSIMGRNVFNNVNVLTPVGNLGSPLFGESNGLAGRPFSDSTSNRRLDLQVTFTF